MEVFILAQRRIEDEHLLPAGIDSKETKMADVSILSRQSPNDMKITFEKDGEAVSIYMDPSQLTASGGVNALADRVSCILCCSGRSGFGACVARCLVDGQCCDSGLRNCSPV